MNDLVILDDRTLKAPGIVAQIRSDGSTEVDLGGESQPLEGPAGEIADPTNLVYYLDDRTKSTIVTNVLDWVDADLRSRARWMELFKRGLERCGILWDQKPMTEDVEGLSQVIHPLITEAATQFQARAIAEIFPSSGPCKGVVLGESDDDIEDQRQRVEDHMNYQMVDEDEEYFDDTDKMLFYLPYAGSAFKKTYRDEQRKATISRFVKSEDVIVPYTARSMVRTPRLTHRLYYSQVEMKELQKQGAYLDVTLGQPAATYSAGGTQEEVDLERRADVKEPSDLQEDAEHVVYECQSRWQIAIEEGMVPQEARSKVFGIDELIGEPAYHDIIVSVERDSRKLLAVRVNWRVDRKGRKVKRQWFAHYKYLPGFGFYGYGLFHAIGGLGESATDALREALDSARFATRQGGFMSEEIKSPRGVLRLKPGVYQRTENTADDLARAFYTPPFKEPSPALIKLFEILVDSGQRFGSITEAMTGESNENTPVGTTVARIEQASMVYSAIHKRLHRSAKTEFAQRAILNGEALQAAPDEFEIEGGTIQISAEDYAGPIRIVPVSDPNITSTPQRIALAQNQYSLAQQNPARFDMQEVLRRVLTAMRVPDQDAILIDQEDIPMADPVSEGALAMIGQPIKAYPEQNHPDHIVVHMGQVQMAQTTPIGPNVMPVLMAHLAEHFALMYLVGMHEQLGIPLPPLSKQLKDRVSADPQMDNEVSMAAAAVVERAMQQAQAMAQAQGAPGPGAPPNPNAPSPAESASRDAVAGEKVKQAQAETTAAMSRAARADTLAHMEQMRLSALPDQLMARIRGMMPQPKAAEGAPTPGGEFSGLLMTLAAEVQRLSGAISQLQTQVAQPQQQQAPQAQP